jgi:hypothetical protein
MFLEFFKYWPSSRDFNKLVIKAKMHANTYFWNFLCYMKIQYDFLLLLFFRDLAVCMKTKTFFYILTKTWYFNTGFVYLQYKNTNRYWSKYSKKYTRKSRIFEKIFFGIFFGLGPARPMWLGRLDPAGFYPQACVNNSRTPATVTV